MNFDWETFVRDVYLFMFDRRMDAKELAKACGLSASSLSRLKHKKTLSVEGVVKIISFTAQDFNKYIIDEPTK